MGDKAPEIGEWQEWRGEKGRIKNGPAPTRSGLRQGAAPDQLVRIAFAFDTGKEEGRYKRHIDPF